MCAAVVRWIQQVPEAQDAHVVDEAHVHVHLAGCCALLEIALAADSAVCHVCVTCVTNGCAIMAV